MLRWVYRGVITDRDAVSPGILWMHNFMDGVDGWNGLDWTQRIIGVAIVCKSEL
jgi:hypothetical protein